MINKIFYMIEKITSYNMWVQKFQIFRLRGGSEHCLKKAKIAQERHHVVKINLKKFLWKDHKIQKLFA